MEADRARNRRVACSAEVPYLMRQVGHSDPKVTLSIYAQVMYRGEGRGSG